MNDLQENKLSTSYAVQKVLDNNNTVWTANVPFATAVTLFKGKVLQIESKRNTQIQENTGAAKEKALKREELENKLFFAANRLQSLAVNTSNQDLLSLVNYKLSDIQKTRDTDLSGLATNILAKANANAAALVPYGLTAALLTDLTNVTTAYGVLLAKPRVAKLFTKAATEALVLLFKELDDILKERLDREIVVYKTSNVDFYNQYTQARKIIQTHKSKLAVKGSIADGASEHPVKGVKVVITNIFGGAKLEADAKEITINKKTTEKGNFQITNLAVGTYQVTLSKLGYTTQAIKINVVDNETTEVEVALQRA